jgi:GNAT superfamily N-acetyltransferase
MISRKARQGIGHNNQPGDARELAFGFLQQENQMIIEIATASDIPALSSLLADLFSQEEEFTPNHETQQRGLALIIDYPAVGAVLVARQGDQIIGMVTLLFTISTALGERVALLEDMVVFPAGRGVGVGTKLLSEAITYSRVQGCKRITLLTDQNNISAQRFYAKQGFVMSSMVPMRIALA